VIVIPKPTRIVGGGVMPFPVPATKIAANRTGKNNFLQLITSLSS